jgi:nucleoside-diphosphate-sugar epimerase
MKILMIGGTGTISTSITAQLLERGDEVTLYNRGKTLARFQGGAKIIHGDRNDFAAFEAQMAAAGHFDSVIDMMCFTPGQAQSVIRAFKGRIGQFIFCSTVDVYTKPPLIHPVIESESRNANSDYGRNKVICEDLFMEAGERGDFAMTTIRPAHTYGDTGNLVHTFGWRTTIWDRLRRGKPIILHGDGTALWVSCHSDDVGRAFVNACGNTTAYGKAYHTTGEEWRTWTQYFHEAAEAIAAPPPNLVYIPTSVLMQVAPQHARISYDNFQFTNILDNTAAKTDLDFRFTVTWSEGVQRMYRWLTAHDRIENCDLEPWYDPLIADWQRATATLTPITD